MKITFDDGKEKFELECEEFLIVATSREERGERVEIRSNMDELKSSSIISQLFAKMTILPCIRDEVFGIANIAARKSIVKNEVSKACEGCETQIQSVT